MPKLKAEKKRKTKEFYDPYCFTNAVKKGDIFTRLSTQEILKPVCI